MRGVKEITKLHHLFPKIAAIGFGNMGEALFSGIRDHLDLKKVVVASPSLCAGSRSTSYPVAKNNRDAARAAKLIILGAKPKDIPSVCTEIAPATAKDAIILSMAAGIPISKIQQYFSENQPIIRIMPNTPVKEKLGVIAMCQTLNMSREASQMVYTMLTTVGTVVRLNNEADFDSFTGIFGSGPAYMDLFLECFDAAAEKHGLMVNEQDKILRRACLIQLMKGAAVLLENSDLSFAAARRQVTSPNGTTHAAVKKFEAEKFKELVISAVDAATARSKEMGKESNPAKVSSLTVFKQTSAESNQLVKTPEVPSSPSVM